MKREACFACTTPYQVLSSIAVQLEKKLDADLYVFGMFENYQAVSEKIKSYGLFANVIPVDCSEIGAPTEKQAAFQMLRPKKYTRAFLDDNVSYDWFYTSSRAHPKLLLLHEIEHRNKNLRIGYVEDGLGTYSPSSTQLNTLSKKRRMLNRLLGWGNLFPAAKTTLMARRPDLIELPDEMCGVAVGQMPDLPTDAETSKMLFDMFGVTKDDILTERVIVFDTVRGLRDVGVKFDVLDRCYLALLEAFPGEVVCKTHPRSRVLPPKELKRYDKAFVPVEVLYSEMKNLKDRILVGICSTAMFSPKLIFGVEPYIIDLHKLTYCNKTYDDLMEKMQSMYSDRNKIFCPATMEEYLNLIKKMA